MKIQIRVGPSQIAGRGLFAAQDIRKGTRIIQYIGGKIPKAVRVERVAQGNAYIFAFNDRYDIDSKTLKNTARYINHSCDPNCEAVVTKHTIWLVALRDIQAGGIHVKRDSLVSVMYAEELNSITSSVTLQRTDRHGILG